MKMRIGTATLVFLLLASLMQCGMAQTTANNTGAASSVQVYSIPFASEGNTIEITVANTAALAVAGVKVNATNVPTWLKFAGLEQKVGMLKPGQEAPATFSFAVDKMAPVKQNQTLKFVISAPTGETWMKEITVTVASPEKFEVFQPVQSFHDHQLPAHDKQQSEPEDLQHAWPGGGIAGGCGSACWISSGGLGCDAVFERCVCVSNYCIR
jgi:hypothetical protein